MSELLRANKALINNAAGLMRDGLTTPLNLGAFQQHSAEAIELCCGNEVLTLLNLETIAKRVGRISAERIRLLEAIIEKASPKVKDDDATSSATINLYTKIRKTRAQKKDAKQSSPLPTITDDETKLLKHLTKDEKTLYTDVESLHTKRKALYELIDEVMSANFCKF